MSKIKAIWTIYKEEVKTGVASDDAAKNLKNQFGKNTKWIARGLVLGFILAVILPLFNFMFGYFSVAYFAVLFVITWKAVKKGLFGGTETTDNKRRNR